MSTFTPQEYQDFLKTNLDVAHQWTGYNDWSILQALQIGPAPGETGVPVNAFPEDHPHAPMPVPDPDDFDANGVSAADSDGYRRLLDFEDFQAAYEREAITAGNYNAAKAIREFCIKDGEGKPRFMWNSEDPAYNTEHSLAVVQFMVGTDGWSAALFFNDREIAVAGPKIDPAQGAPYNVEKWMASNGGLRSRFNFQAGPYTWKPYKLVLVDTLDEDSGTTRVTNDAITVERANEIAREALTIVAQDANMVPWDGPWGR